MRLKYVMASIKMYGAVGSFRYRNNRQEYLFFFFLNIKASQENTSKSQVTYTSQQSHVIVLCFIVNIMFPRLSPAGFSFLQARPQLTRSCKTFRSRNFTSREWWQFAPGWCNCKQLRNAHKWTPQTEGLVPDCGYSAYENLRHIFVWLWIVKLYKSLQNSSCALICMWGWEDTYKYKGMVK